MPKITDLPPAGPLTGAETLPIVQGDETRLAPFADVLGLVVAEGDAQRVRVQDEGEAKIATMTDLVNDVGDAVDTITTLAPLVSSTETTAGPTPGAGTAITANTNAFNVNHPMVAGILNTIEAYVGTIGTGVIEFDIATFSGGTGTCIKRIALTVAASDEGAGGTGLKTWSREAIRTAAGGDVQVPAGAVLGSWSNTGQAIITRGTVAGTSCRYAAGAPAEGVSRSYTLLSNSEYLMRATTIAFDVEVSASLLDADTQQTISSVGDVITVDTERYGLAAAAASGTAVAVTSAHFFADTRGNVDGAGFLSEFRTYIQSAGSGNLMILVARRAGNSITTIRKFTVNLSSSQADGAETVWSRAALEAAAGGPVALSPGDTVGYYVFTGGAQPAYSVGGASNLVFRAGEPDLNTAYTYTANASTPQYSFKVATASVSGTARLPRRTLLSDTIFSAAANADWTQTGVWSQGAGGWQSPAAPVAYTTALKHSAFVSNLRKRSIVWEFSPASTSAIVLFAWETSQYQYMCSAVTVDWTAGLLRLKNAMGTMAVPIGSNGQGYISDPGDFATAALPAAIAGRKYRMVMTVDERTNTYELWDTVSGAVVARVEDAVSGKTTLNFVTGCQAGTPVCRPLSGQVTISRVRVLANCARNTGLMIIGDSLVDGQGLPLAARWATQLGEAFGDYIVSARGGETSSVVTSLWTSEVSHIQPSKVILALGINGQTINQAAFNSFIASCQGAGIEVIVCLVQPHFSGGSWLVPAAANAYLLGLGNDIAKVRLDLAMSASNDGATGNTTLYATDLLHHSAAAAPVIATRVQFDADTLCASGGSTA